MTHRITNVFCAKKQVGHACICPRMVDGHWLASFEVILPPKQVSFSATKIPTENCFPDPIFFENFGVFCLCGENFVTPFSTLAMIKGSLPTNSTTPDRLRWRARPSDVDFTFHGFLRRKSIQKKLFSCPPASSPDLHPKRSP